MRQALAKFPNSRRPADFKECMKFLDQHEEFFEDLSTEFLGSQNEPIEDILASYIRKNAEAFQEYLK